MELARVLSPDRPQSVAPTGPFRALGVRSHGKGTFTRVDDLDALASDKSVYRVEPNRFIVNIVFAWEGAVAITSEEDAGALVSHRFPTFSVNEELLDLDYFRHVIRTEGFRQLLALASPGGAGRNKTLNRQVVLRFEICLPPLPEQRRIAAALTTLERRAKSLQSYYLCLLKQRKALASGLLAGCLRVPDAERLGVAAVG
jgi:type I restriction enzyme S subunit